MKGNAKECQGNVREDANCQGNAGECRGMLGDRTVVGTKCQGNGGEFRGMQRNAGECQGNVWECKLPGECRECREMPGECMGVGV